VSLAPTDGKTPKETETAKALPSKDLPSTAPPSKRLPWKRLPSKNGEAPGGAGDEKLAPGRIVAAMVFALFALAFFAAGVVLAITPAQQLPGFLGHADSPAHHTLRGVGSLIVGLVFTAAAWFALRYQSLALEEARAADAAASDPPAPAAAEADNSENLPAA
jgi:hypothetical protein